MRRKSLTMAEWLQMGVDNKWCTTPICYMHDVVDLTDEECSAIDEGYDPCLHVVRLWEQTD